MSVRYLHVLGLWKESYRFCFIHFSFQNTLQVCLRRRLDTLLNRMQLRSRSPTCGGDAREDRKSWQRWTTGFYCRGCCSVSYCETIRSSSVLKGAQKASKNTKGSFQTVKSCLNNANPGWLQGGRKLLTTDPKLLRLTGSEWDGNVNGWRRSSTELPSAQIQLVAVPIHTCLPANITAHI